MRINAEENSCIYVLIGLNLIKQDIIVETKTRVELEISICDVERVFCILQELFIFFVNTESYTSKQTYSIVINSFKY